MKNIILKKDQVSDLDTVKESEWLETNGLGGWSSSTVSGINSRRFHGVYVRSLAPPLKRYVLVSDLAEELFIDGQKIELNTNEFHGGVHPKGYKYLDSFEKGLDTSFVYSGEGFRLRKSLMFVHNTNTLLVKYDVEELYKNSEILLRPFLNDRPAEHLTLDYVGIDVNEASEKSALNLNFFSVNEKLRIHAQGSTYSSKPDWYKSFFFSEEKARGYDCHEHLYTPGYFLKKIKKGDTFFISFSEKNIDSPQKHWDLELDRRRNLISTTNDKGVWYESHLRLAADQFIVKRGENLKTIIAGYPWFSDWGRDTMIALPGLCLTTNRFDDAKKIILAFASNIDQGMIPNRFVEGDEEKEYNTIDATLWFFNAIYQYCKASNDLSILKNGLIEKFYEILNYHISGTRYGIKVDLNDGLLEGGESGVQLTWMDAKVGDWVVTPRIGKPVEINALWYNAVCVFIDLCQESCSILELDKLKSIKSKIEISFSKTFYRPDKKGLYDNVTNEIKDDSIRPNQLIALSLPHSVIDKEKALEVLDVCRKELLIPYGLRSLSLFHKDYVPKYKGGQLERDGSYHQGTAWSWLLGPYLESVLKFKGSEGKHEVSEFLVSFGDHLKTSGIGMVSEIFDPSGSYSGNGCISQAWGVSEMLRIINLVSKS